MFGSKIAIALCLGAFVCIVGADDVAELDGFALFDTYSQLNSYLEEKVKSTDSASNIDAVSNLLNSPEGAKFMNQEDLSNAIRLFQSLQTLNAENQCTAHSAKLLRNNYYAAFGYPQAGFTHRVQNRQINQVIKNLCLAHAQVCRPDYLAKWEKATQNVDPEVERTVSYMFEKLLDTGGYVDKAQVMNDPKLLTEVSRMIINIIFMQSTYTSDILKEMAHDDPDVKYLTPVLGRVNEAKVNGLASRYLMTPCKSYMSPLEDVFEPAEVDSLVGLDVESDNMEFHRSWAKYRYCEAFTEAMKTSAFAV